MTVFIIEFCVFVLIFHRIIKNRVNEVSLLIILLVSWLIYSSHYYKNSDTVINIFKGLKTAAILAVICGIAFIIYGIYVAVKSRRK
jgi:hypothetical protein